MKGPGFPCPGALARGAAAVLLCLCVAFPAARKAAAAVTGEAAVETYAQQLSRIREAGLEHMHGALNEKKRSEVLAGARRDMQVRVFFYDKGVRQGYAVSAAELAAFRRDRAAAYVTEQALARILERAGVSEKEYLRLLEIELLANRYTRDVILPKVKVTDDQVRGYYRENLRTFRERGRIVADIISVTSPEPLGPGARNAAYALAEAARRERLADADIPTWRSRIGDGGRLSIQRDVELSSSSGAPHSDYYRELAARKQEILVVDRDSKEFSIIAVVSRVEDRVVPLDEVKEPVKKVLEKEAFENAIWKEFRQGQAAAGRPL